MPRLRSLVIVAVVACATTPVSGSFIVGIDPRLDPTVRLDVTITVDGEVQLTRALPAPVANAPIEIAVDPAGNPNANISVSVIGYSSYSLYGSSIPVITRNAQTHFVEGKSVLLPIVLDGRCTDSILQGGGVSLPAPRCTGSSTCIDGKCDSPSIPSASLGAYSPTWSNDDVCGTANAPVALVAGRDGATFVPIVDGDTLVPEQGAQGGYHVFLGFRARNVHRKSSKISAFAKEVNGPGLLPPAVWDFPLGVTPDGECTVGAVRWVLDSSGSLVGIQGKLYDAEFSIDDGTAKTTITRRIQL